MEWVIFIVRDHSFIAGDGGEGGVRVSEDFWGGHMVFQENRGVSRSLTGVREGTMENWLPIRGEGGGSVIRLLQSLFQSLIGSLGISYCGTNKTPPKPVPHPSIGDK